MKRRAISKGKGKGASIESQRRRYAAGGEGERSGYYDNAEVQLTEVQQVLGVRLGVPWEDGAVADPGLELDESECEVSVFVRGNFTNKSDSSPRRGDSTPTKTVMTDACWVPRQELFEHLLGDPESDGASDEEFASSLLSLRERLARFEAALVPALRRQVQQSVDALKIRRVAALAVKNEAVQKAAAEEEATKQKERAKAQYRELVAAQLDPRGDRFSLDPRGGRGGKSSEDGGGDDDGGGGDGGGSSGAKGATEKKAAKEEAKPAAKSAETPAAKENKKGGGKASAPLTALAGSLLPASPPPQPQASALPKDGGGGGGGTSGDGGEVPATFLQTSKVQQAARSPSPRPAASPRRNSCSCSGDPFTEAQETELGTPKEVKPLASGSGQFVSNGKLRGYAWSQTEDVVQVYTNLRGETTADFTPDGFVVHVS